MLALELPLWGVEIYTPGQIIGDLFVRAARLLKLGCPLRLGDLAGKAKSVGVLNGSGAAAHAANGSAAER